MDPKVVVRLPEYSCQSWRRAVAAMALAELQRARPEAILRRAWPRDATADLIFRSAVSPTTTADFPATEAFLTLPNLAPASAAVRLFAYGLQLDMGGVTTVRVPNVATPPAAAFVAE